MNGKAVVVRRVPLGFRRRSLIEACGTGSLSTTVPFWRTSPTLDLNLTVKLSLRFVDVVVRGRAPLRSADGFVSSSVNEVVEGASTSAPPAVTATVTATGVSGSVPARVTVKIAAPPPSVAVALTGVTIRSRRSLLRRGCRRRSSTATTAANVISPAIRRMRVRPLPSHSHAPPEAAAVETPRSVCLVCRSGYVQPTSMDSARA